PACGGLGYGQDHPNDDTDATRIRNSVAIKFDLYNNSGEGINSTGIFTDGRSPTVRRTGLSSNLPDRSVNLSAAPYLDMDGQPLVNLNNQTVKEVHLVYDGTTLTETITDEVSGHSVTIIYDNVDLPGIIGSDSAYAGFTGGTGGLTVVQDVRTWFYHTEGSSRPAAPTNLVADPYSNPGIVHLNWRYSSAHEDGFQIERSDDGGQTY